MGIVGITIQNHTAIEKQMGHYRYKKLILELYDIINNELNPLEYLYLDQGHSFYFNQYLSQDESLTAIQNAFQTRLQQLLLHNHGKNSVPLQYQYFLLKEVKDGREALNKLKAQLR